MYVSKGKWPYVTNKKTEVKLFNDGLSAEVSIEWTERQHSVWGKKAVQNYQSCSDFPKSTCTSLSAIE